MSDKIYRKFSAVLDSALKNGVVSFASTPVLEEYQPKYAYRCVIRGEKYKPLNRSDFNSQMERGQNGADEHKIEDYSCSLGIDLKYVLSFAKRYPPLKKWKCAEGDITDDMGIINECGGHINLWLYDNVDPSATFVMKDI